jgi:hypothetical protein
MADNVQMLAFVLDGEVVEILQTDDRLASIFLSQPKIVAFDREKENVVAGMKYDGTKFSTPE